MTMSELNPAPVLEGISSLPYSQPLELEKTCIAPPPPTTHAPSVEDMLWTAFHNLALDNILLGGSRAGNHRSPSGGEHKVDDSGPSRSPLRQPEKSPSH